MEPKTKVESLILELENEHESNEDLEVIVDTVEVSLQGKSNIEEVGKLKEQKEAMEKEYFLASEEVPFTLVTSRRRRGWGACSHSEPIFEGDMNLRGRSIKQSQVQKKDDITFVFKWVQHKVNFPFLMLTSKF